MNNKIYILKERGLLYVQGEDVNEFLQNIISNDINRVTKDNLGFVVLKFFFLITVFATS